MYIRCVNKAASCSSQRRGWKKIGGAIKTKGELRTGSRYGAKIWCGNRNLLNGAIDGWWWLTVPRPQPPAVPLTVDTLYSLPHIPRENPESRLAFGFTFYRLYVCTISITNNNNKKWAAVGAWCLRKSAWSATGVGELRQSFIRTHQFTTLVKIKEQNICFYFI